MKRPKKVHKCETLKVWNRGNYERINMEIYDFLLVTEDKIKEVMMGWT
jgi:hypothetical protein